MDTDLAKLCNNDVPVIMQGISKVDFWQGQTPKSTQEVKNPPSCRAVQAVSTCTVSIWRRAMLSYDGLGQRSPVAYAHIISLTMSGSFGSIHAHMRLRQRQ